MFREMHCGKEMGSKSCLNKSAQSSESYLALVKQRGFEDEQWSSSFQFMKISGRAVLQKNYDLIKNPKVQLPKVQQTTALMVSAPMIHQTVMSGKDVAQPTSAEIAKRLCWDCNQSFIPNIVPEKVEAWNYTDFCGSGQTESMLGSF